MGSDNSPALWETYPHLTLAPSAPIGLDVLGGHRCGILAEGHDERVHERPEPSSGGHAASVLRDRPSAVEVLMYTEPDGFLAFPEKSIESLDVVGDQRLFVGVELDSNFIHYRLDIELDALGIGTPRRRCSL